MALAMGGLLVCNAMVCLHLWMSRKELVGILPKVRASLKAASPVSKRARKRLDEIQIMYAKQFASVIASVQLLFFVAGLLQPSIFSQLFTASGPDQYILTKLLTLYGLCLLIMAMPRTPVKIWWTSNHWELVFSMIMMLVIVRTLTCSDDRSFFLVQVEHILYRLWLAIMQMNLSRMTVWNVVYSVCNVIAYSQNTRVCKDVESNVSDHIAIVVTEFAMCIGTLFCSCVFETWHQSTVRAHVETKDARRAASSVLGAACDAIVYVTADFKIGQPSPKLMHLLDPSYVGDGSGLEGHCFTGFVREPDERRYLQSVLTSQLVEEQEEEVDSIIFPAASLNVHLCDFGGRSFPVQLLLCSLRDANANPCHLVGIRLVGSSININQSLPTCDNGIHKHAATECEGIHNDFGAIEFDAGTPRLSILRCSGNLLKDGEHVMRDLVDVLPEDTVDEFVEWVLNEINDAPSDDSYVRSRGTWNSLRMYVAKAEVQADVAWLEIAQLDENDDALHGLPVTLHLMGVRVKQCVRRRRKSKSLPLPRVAEEVFIGEVEDGDANEIFPEDSVSCGGYCQRRGSRRQTWPSQSASASQDES